MNQLLTLGQMVRAEHGAHDCRVEKFLGGGGQGEVYSADVAGRIMALKWYFKWSATTKQRQRLAALVEKGAPDSRFLWPIDIATAQNVPGFGYLMPLRPPAYRGLVDLMKRRCEPSFRALVRAGIQLADSFLQLHTRGFCYCDISFGNVFFDPDSGDVLICDNDNVSVNKDDVEILGTQCFMAPEIVRGEAGPSTRTDLYSLSVLLFYMFMVHHPLEGEKESVIRCLDAPAMTKLYGQEPVFIFDPVNTTNRPVKGLHDNAIEYWPLYPKFFQDLFIRSFTTGLADPDHGRVRESEWRQALARLGDGILYCAHCGNESFYDEEKLKGQGTLPPCWSCNKGLVLPLRIRIGKSVVMLNHDSRLFPHHIDPDRLYDFSAPVAEISRHPANPSIWGLKNLSGKSWTATRPDGSLQVVESGRSVSLGADLKIEFGKVQGTVRV